MMPLELTIKPMRVARYKFLLAFLVAFSMTFAVAAPYAQANSGKAFMMSVIYGTLAGTLVGAATLAFTTNPSSNLNNVARGGSYGLYAGILMGWYVNSMDEDGNSGRSEQNPSAPGESRPANPDQNQTQPEDANPSLFKQKLNVREINLAFHPYLLAPPANGDNRWGVAVNFIEGRF